MPFKRFVLTAASVAMALYGSAATRCQDNEGSGCGASVHASARAAIARSQITGTVNDSARTVLAGNTHYLAKPEFDRGQVDADLPMERLILVLRRTPEQETALNELMEAQYDPQSPSFHRWCEPDEFGRLFGPSDSDIEAVTGWLKSRGFRIDRVSSGRIAIEFSGTARQVDEAFHTEIHRYVVNGVEHIANDRDPEIPSALFPAVEGIASLHDFFPTHQSVLGGFVRRDRKTGEITLLDSPDWGVSPELTYTDLNGKVHEDITPFDFATIYNLLPLWKAGITGSGQTVAISGVSDIEQSDVDTFRGSFGLPASTVEQLINGADPGVVAGATIENSLDVEWSGATAPQAKIVLVVTKTTATTFGGQLSNLYTVDHKTATIASASYGACEAAIGNAGNSALNKIYQQGAAEGISMFVSAGDQGSTGCDNSDAAGPSPAKYGLQVNGWASSPYVTGVGGTDFNWYQSTNRTTYWNSANNSDGATAKGYIPELPWNPTCTSAWLLTANPSFGSAEGLCLGVYISSQFDVLVKVSGGSGGVSSCTLNTGGKLSTCSGGYAKPWWQTGKGVPADGKRDVPDVALFAAGGWPAGLDGSAYLLCVAANSPVGCDYSDPSYMVYQEVGGTSVSSPAMAGIMAMVQQKMGGKSQGLANPVLYKLAAKENLGGCNTNSVRSGNGCVFYDITTGTNEQVCDFGSVNCIPDSVEPLGIVSGYNSTIGYDRTTGLGSLNAYNLVGRWASAIGPAIALSASSLNFAGTKVGSHSAAKTVAIVNTGTSKLVFSGGITKIAGKNPSSFTRSTTCASTLAPGAKCSVSVAFRPQAPGELTATLELMDNAAGSPQRIALSGTGLSTK